MPDLGNRDATALPEPPRANAATEAERRAALGVPASATEVVVVAESTHWDPNWLLRADQYFRCCVRPALDRVLDALEAQPRRVFSLECLFFVDRYWRARPEHRDRLRSLVNAGRLRFTGTGVTTPDTLLPDDEVLLRDLLLGQEWLRTRDLRAEPRLLYLPDSFGHSPCLPALLRAAGIERAAVCRIAGMRFPGADLERAANFPRPGTSAAELLALGTADFVWRAPDGSEVLTHWMAHGYGHGDMIASGGLSRALGLPVSWPDRRPSRVDRRVDGYRAQLRAVARTPYRLLAIGFDFVRPIPRLVEVLDAWNARHHGATGVWLVNATIDDYLDLVEHHREALPTLALDPNPYWSGFYASRPGLKAAARELGRRLVAGDAARAVRRAAGLAAEPDDSAAAWWVAATSNHHDFVTGTAPDRVAIGEQEVWLADAIARAPWPVVAAPAASHALGAAGDRRPAAAALRVEREGRLTVVRDSWGAVTFDPAAGGAAISATDARGVEQLAGPSLVVASFVDGGGLWRLGQEIHGGRWSLADVSSRHPAAVDVALADDGAAAEVRIRASCDGFAVELRHAFRAGDPTVVTRTSMHARRRRSVALVMRPQGAAAGLTMHQPGGVVERPLRRWYQPTFWPLHSFAVTTPAVAAVGAPGGEVVRLACAVASPTGVHVAADGTLEVLVARTPFKEIAFGVIPVTAPAWAWRTGRQEAVVAWRRLAAGEALERLDAVRVGRSLARAAGRAVGWPDVAWPVTVDDSDAEVAAVKPASRGPGVVVRLRDWTAGADGRPARASRTVRLHVSPALGALDGARLADSRERDLGPLALDAGGGVVVPLAGHLTTVRLILAGASPGRSAHPAEVERQ